MTLDPPLRTLGVDIPSQPQALLRLSLLMAEEQPNMGDLAALIEGDMALASAVLRAVNSSLYGLSGRVQSVRQAITYLGMREVAGITLEMGLRAVFPAAGELEPIWQRAPRRALLMSRLGQLLDVDAWAAHSAGLFEECGKAVLFRHASDHYRTMLRAAHDDSQLCELEIAGFGIGHDALGAALCERWGLSAPAVISVRHHVATQAGQQLPQALTQRGILTLSVLAHVLMTDAAALDAAAARIAPQAGLDTQHVLRSARTVQQQIEAAEARGR
jgi:HD-like signal output (HDOD) protein